MKERERVDAYLETIARIEQNIAMIDEGTSAASISISLKRIADLMEAASKPPQIKRPASESEYAAQLADRIHDEMKRQEDTSLDIPPCDVVPGDRDRSHDGRLSEPTNVKYRVGTAILVRLGRDNPVGTAEIGGYAIAALIDHMTPAMCDEAWNTWCNREGLSGPPQGFVKALRAFLEKAMEG